MAIKVTYKGVDIIDADSCNKKLTTAGKYLEDDVTIVATGGGGAEKPSVDMGVNFVDFDGSIIDTWLPSEVAEKTALPVPPDHSHDTWEGHDVGLTFQEWNWTLAEIKTYMAKYPMAAMTIGACYITTDGEHKFCIEIDDETVGISFNSNVNASSDIDWGDGTKESYTAMSASGVHYKHYYAHKGKYMVSVKVASGGNFILMNGAGYQIFVGTYTTARTSATKSFVKRVYMGNGAKVTGDPRFQLPELEILTLPSNTVCESVTVVAEHFSSCGKLKCVILPRTYTAFRASGLTSCRYLSFPATIVTIRGGNISGGYKYVALPDSCIDMFMSGVVRTFGGAQMVSLTFPDTVTQLPNYTIDGAYSLKYLHIPEGFITLPDSFFASANYALNVLRLPSTLETFPTGALKNLEALTDLEIPANVTSLGGTYFLQNSGGLGQIKFLPTTPPAATTSGTFTGIPTSCKFIVPKGHLSDYQNATNYPAASKVVWEEWE